MLPSAGRTASASQLLDFGAEPSRPASLLCTLRTHQSPDEWQHSLPACSLALTGRDLHPLDFIRWFPLLHFWFLHFHAYPSATYRKSHSAVFTRRNMLHWAQNRSQYQFARDSLEHLLPYGSRPAWESVPAGVHEVYGCRVRQIGQGEERRIGCQGSHPIEVVSQPFCRQVVAPSAQLRDSLPELLLPHSGRL